MFYQNELRALTKSALLRTRKIYSDSILDFASNDYLGLANDKKSAKLALKLALNETAPRASMLVNGYGKLHKKLEKNLAKNNGFEKGIIVGSGFLANIALFEALVRSKDIIFIDEHYHASGILASKLLKNVEIFKHNDVLDLEAKILNAQHKKSFNRMLIAIEGIYSMSGDIASKEFALIAKKYNCILIVDEAHSSGVLGRNLNGYFDFYNLNITPNIIKMGTFSKSYGSYGSYILSSRHIARFLVSRAKPIIYSTALSHFDTALALINVEKIQKNKQYFYKKIQKNKKLVEKILGVKLFSQIFAIKFHHQDSMLACAKRLKKSGFLVGAIRKPTVEVPMLRIILSIKHKKKDILRLCTLLKKSSSQFVF